MLPLSPRRRFLSLAALASAAAALFVTKPRFSAAGSGATDENTVACLSNLNRIARAYALYARDFDGKIPRGVDPEDHFHPGIWQNPEASGGEFYDDALSAPMLHQVLRPYVASPEVFHCPGDVGWKVSRLQISGINQGLTNVLPTAYKKLGTSYFCWTIYGFQLSTAADIENPSQKILLFDGDLWHSNAGRQLINGMFADGHVQNLTVEQFNRFSPNE
ncbi:MAG TPA: hypothetical protein VF627_05075 [Abditibacterium sp.]|jgi:prepilin-type processing-associated H-X9-DG protein